MTYKQMTKRIENINAQIQFIKNIADVLSDKEDLIMCGDIINSLCSWKNTLIYDKEYILKPKS